MRMMSAVVLTFFSLSLAGQTSNASARAIAKQAYETIRAHPFEGSFLQAAASDIKRAGALDPKESYVFLATAALVETTGYKNGDWSRAASFDPKALALAEKLLKHAIDLDPSAVEPHLDMAWMHVIARRFPEAQHEYHVAHELAPDDFRVWYGQAVCLWKQNNIQKSQVALAGAEARAKTLNDKKTLLGQKERVAEAAGDLKAVEAILQEHIRLEPRSPWAFGNYGAFLLNQGRYDEAVSQYEKALSLGSYPAAVNQLEEAKRLRDDRPRARP